MSSHEVERYLPPDKMSGLDERGACTETFVLDEFWCLKPKFHYANFPVTSAINPP